MSAPAMPLRARYTLLRNNVGALYYGNRSLDAKLFRARSRLAQKLCYLPDVFEARCQSVEALGKGPLGRIAVTTWAEESALREAA